MTDQWKAEAQKLLFEIVAFILMDFGNIEHETRNFGLELEAMGFGKGAAMDLIEEALRVQKTVEQIVNLHTKEKTS